MLNHTEKKYDEMTREELEQELREAFLDTDTIDEPLNDELEKMQETLNRKWPLAYLYTPEESWERFRENHAEFFQSAASASDRPETEKAEKPHESELKERNGSQANTVRLRSVSALVRKVIIAAVIVVLLTGAVLAADSLGLWAWVPRWNAVAGRYEPAAEEAAQKPIPAALAELGIDEPVYPARLPEGFVITESHISEDPLVLMEQYAKGDRLFSVTVTPIKGFKNAVYQASGLQPQVYRSGKAVHYVFANEETIIAVWYTKNYATTVSGNIPLEEIERIMESFGSASEGGNAP